MRILYLGDIHGKFDIIPYKLKLYDITDAHIIQVGDFGVGFLSFETELEKLTSLNDLLIEKNVFLYVIRGNHDFPLYFKKDPFKLSNIKLIPDYSILNLEGKRILCVGGAISTDREERIKKYKSDSWLESPYGTNVGDAWWVSEGFDFNIDIIKDIKDIDIVVTHTIPDYCSYIGLDHLNISETLKANITKEQRLLSDMFWMLSVDNNITNHYCGHLHISDYIDMKGTRHRILAINELWEENNYEE